MSSRAARGEEVYQYCHYHRVVSHFIVSNSCGVYRWIPMVFKYSSLLYILSRPATLSLTMTEGSRLYQQSIFQIFQESSSLSNSLRRAKCGKTKATQSFKDGESPSPFLPFHPQRREPSRSDLTSTGPNPSPSEEPFEMNPALLISELSPSISVVPTLAPSCA